MANPNATETEAAIGCKTLPQCGACLLTGSMHSILHNLHCSITNPRAEALGRDEQPCIMPSPTPAWFFIPAVTRTDDSCIAAGFSCILIRSNPYQAKSPVFAYDRAMLLLVISQVYVQLLNTDSSLCHHSFKVKNLFLILLLIHCSLGLILIKLKISWSFWGRELRYLPIRDY